jgi:hypothetical protein
LPVDRSCSWRPNRGTLCCVMRTPTVASYYRDPLHGHIAYAVEDILRRGKVVMPVDVLAGMGLLTHEHLEDWRFGRVPYLERLINCNLVRLGRLLRILRFHAHDLNLKPSLTAYMRWGERTKATPGVHQDGKPEARGGLRNALRVAGQGTASPSRVEGKRAVNQGSVDLEKLRVALRQMSRGHLLLVAERAIEMVTTSELHALVGDLVRPPSLTEGQYFAAPMLDEVREFHDASLHGDYYDSFDVNSKNCTEKSKGTEAFIAEFDRLIGKCLRTAADPTTFGFCPVRRCVL